MQWSTWSKHVFGRDNSHAISCAISRQEKGGLYNCIARFITHSSPGRADNWFPSLPRKECTGVRYVTTKFSRMDGLPNFLIHGAPLARFARQSSANISSLVLGCAVNHSFIGPINTTWTYNFSQMIICSRLISTSPDMARLILQCPRLLIFGWCNWVLIRMGIALSQNATTIQLLLETKTWLSTNDICYHNG